MKNIQLIRVVILLFTLVLFNSCDEVIEPIDPALIENLQTQNPNCLSPIINSGAFVTSTSATINWSAANGETSWQIEYGISGFELGSGSSTNASTNSTTISGLVSTNGYDFYIRSVCSSEEFGSWWGPYTIEPQNPNCLTPSGLTVGRNTGNTTATVNWTAGGTETSWEVVYVNAGYPKEQGTKLTATSKPFTVSGLTNQSYDFYVRAKCSGNEFSSWSLLKNLPEVSSGGSCNVPTGLTVTRNSVFQTQASVNWTAGGTETSWDIQYGSVGFSLGQGTIVNTTTKPKNITSLTSASYDFYVRAKCSATENSNWVGPINIAAVQAIDNSPAMMTANIDGTQYDFMQPYLYSVTHNDVNVLNTGASANEPRHLWIQGNTSDNLSTLKEINLYIPSTKFVAGTYTLFEKEGFENIDFCQAHLIIAPGSANSTYCDITSGTITITEFNLATKRVKGTFSFVYEKSINGDPVGTFEVTNGTFNYGLDHSYFN